MPGYDHYNCDDCVPRGCTCNFRYDELPSADEVEGKDWKWIEGYGSKFWVTLDERGREYPCCEYDFQKEGYDRE